MPRFPIGTPHGVTLNLDTDAPAGFSTELSAYVGARETAARDAEAVNTLAATKERDALREVVADEVLALRALRVGTGFDAAGTRAHLLTLSAAQLAFEHTTERAASAGAPARQTSDGAPADQPAGTGAAPPAPSDPVALAAAEADDFTPKPRTA